jgi:tellurite resistance protein
MSWRGALRAIEAAERRAQRDQQRRYRDLQRRTKELAKLSVLEQARLEVETYENRLDVLLSIHKDQGEEWNWKQVRDTPPPVEPGRGNRHQTEVERQRAGYRPGFFDKLFGKAKKQEAAFALELEHARARDEQDFQSAWAQYQRDIATWGDERKLAEAVLAGDDGAFSRVLRELTPFAELAELGSGLNVRVHTPQLLEVLLQVNGQQAIPSEVKSLTASGKVSTKAMPKGRFNEIYHDYVCGCVLRVARELFALLPSETVIVTASANLFDSRTGRNAEQPILSVAMPRAVVKQLNFERLDPSDAMENFLHRGEFKASRKAGAFVAITPLTPAELDASANPVAQTKASSAALAPTVSPSVNPFPARWAEGLRRGDVESGFLRLGANELAGLLGKESKDNFTLPESKALARDTEDFGYCLEPDPRYGGGNFWGNRELGIFQPPSGDAAEPSENFLGASALFQLCLLVAAADGVVDRRELDQFRRFIESQFQFTPDEHQRFVVLETLLARNAASAKVTLGRTAKRVPKEKHIVIAQLLVDIAAADGVISPPEHKALARIFDALGLSVETLDTLIRNLASGGNEVVIQGAEKSVRGEALPTALPETEAVGFKLDMTRVAAISAETHEVIGLLAKAMAEDDEGSTGYQPVRPGNLPGGMASASLVESGILSASNGSVAPSGRLPLGTGESPVPPKEALPCIELLDVKFHSVTLRLIARDAWTRAEFEALVREHHLMPLSVFDVINEWADEHHGDFLLEGEETIVVHRSILNP